MTDLEGLEILAAGHRREADEAHELIEQLRQILGARPGEKTVDTAMRVVRRGDRERRRIAMVRIVGYALLGVALYVMALAFWTAAALIFSLAVA